MDNLKWVKHQIGLTTFVAVFTAFPNASPSSVEATLA